MLRCWSEKQSRRGAGQLGEGQPLALGWEGGQGLPSPRSLSLAYSLVHYCATLLYPLMATAQSGLSRRRGGGGGPSTTNGNPTGGGGGGPTSPSLGASGSSRPTTPLQVGGTGHKVAYDERDLESGEDRIMPKLTLMEEVLLLGLKDKQVSTTSYWMGSVTIPKRLRAPPRRLSASAMAGSNNASLLV